MTKRWILVLLSVLVFAACTKDGDTIYQPDPDEPKASTAPLVTVIYGMDALGDRSYNDLIFQGVEKTARENGLRTMQMSPTSYEEGLAYLQTMFQTVSATKTDTVRRLFIVCAAGYDGYIRQNAHLFAENPNADLLYLETPDPLPEGCGSTLYMPYYGAMYEAGAIAPYIKTQQLIIASNPVDETVAGAVSGFSDGFNTDYYNLHWSYETKQLDTLYLASGAGQGYNIPDSTALQIFNDYKYVNASFIPICGGASTKFYYLANVLVRFYIGVDVDNDNYYCNLSAVKHIDRAVQMCIAQWLSPEGMPRHQVLGLASGYTEAIVHLRSLWSDDDFKQYIPESLRQQIHEDAIRKEEAYEKK